MRDVHAEKCRSICVARQGAYASKERPPTAAGGLPDAGTTVPPILSTWHLDFVRFVTAALTRTSPASIALVLGVVGVALPAGAFIAGDLSGTLAGVIGLYAL